MDNSKYQQGLKELQGRNFRLGAAVSALALMLLVALLCMLRMAGNTQTILVPPTIERTFWVSRDQASQEYLEEMAGFISWLILDVTPESIDWKTRTVLRYVAPEESGALKIRQEVEAARMKNLNASTAFAIQKMLTNEKEQSVLLIGQLTTKVNGERTSMLDKQYLAMFAFSGGRVHIKSFKEVSNATKQ